MNTLCRHYFVAASMLGGLLLSLLPASVCFGVAFQDRTATFYPIVLQSADKAAWGDFNNDSWVDLCVNGHVLRNNAGVSFSHAGWNTGYDGLWGDFNNDGGLDLFSSASKTLLQNDGVGGFVDVSSKIPSFGTHVSRGAAWADLNNDGHLDLYVGGGEVPTYPDKVLTYNKVSQQFDATWQETVYVARGVTAADFDRDGDQDVYVSNYRLQPNRLWRNNGTGGITDVASSYGVAGAAHTIGSAWGDFDNDGYLDLFAGNFSHPGQEPAHFLKNMGPGGSYHLQNVKDLSGADWQESYASPALADYDNDGDLDLFLTAVYAGDQSRLYRNEGSWQFTDITDTVGLGGNGGYQAAWGDVDNDGDLDLATGGKLYVNDAQSNGNHWLKIKVEGNGTTVNRSAIGAQVRVSAGGEFMTRQVEGGTGEGNQNDLTLHYGLGSYSSLVDIDVLWPDGTKQTFTGVGTDQTMTMSAPAYTDIVMQDNFNDMSIDSTKWVTLVSGDGVIDELASGWLSIQPNSGRAFLVTKDEWDPNVAPVTVSGLLYAPYSDGMWTFLRSADYLRGDGEPEGGTYLAMSVGIVSAVNTDTIGAFHYYPDGATPWGEAAGTDASLPSTSPLEHMWDFMITDDGSSVTTTMTSRSDPSKTATHTFASSQDSYGSYHIGFQASSFGYWDDIVISQAKVPEPSALILSLMAGLGLLAYAWRKRR